MLTVLSKNIKESTISVVPVVALVLILNLTPLVNFTLPEVITFIVASVFLILGIGLFNLGADLAMTPMGDHVGSGLTKLKPGDSVSFCDAAGVVHHYAVEKVQYTDETNVDAVKDSGYPLVLYTCTFYGDLRSVVFCSYADGQN